MSYFDKTKLTDSSGNIINPAQDDSIALLRKIVKLLEASATSDTKQRQKVVMEAIGTNNGTPTEVNATIPVTSTAAASSVNTGNVTIQYGAQATAAGSGIDSRFSMIDTARTAYANGVRAKLNWS